MIYTKNDCSNCQLIVHCTSSKIQFN